MNRKRTIAAIAGVSAGIAIVLSATASVQAVVDDSPWGSPKVRHVALVNEALSLHPDGSEGGEDSPWN
jgi:hypothetical protein